MQFIRYINLFTKITNIKIQHCFEYNQTIIFVVPISNVSRAIGEDGKNVKKISQILGKKIKVIAEPHGKQDMNRFISGIVNPVKYKNIEIENDKVTINATIQSRAALIGRNKVRLEELKDILESYFGIKEIKIA